MDLKSRETIALLNAQNEVMSVNEDIEEDETETQGTVQSET